VSMTNYSLDPRESALKTLDDALKRAPLDDLMRDGAIQRFKYCAELSWKAAKNKLEQNGLRTSTPKDVYRVLAQAGWVQDAKPWFEYLDARNQTSHMYKEDVANAIFKVLPGFLRDAQILLETLKSLK